MAPRNGEPDPNADILKILIATDNHLGYMEKDEVRKDDSFEAFEEIFQIAQREKVDFVLLGGDLFHDNKPSRPTLVKAIEILSRYCLGDDPVKVQVISDQGVNFPNNRCERVNYEDENLNVCLPVFTIHGNHDDPGGGDNLSAVDILSSCNLVNYFGKSGLTGQGVGKVKLYPILLEKGDTKVALYGLGNIRDERLARMMQTPGNVQWVRPDVKAGYPKDCWFNIFTLHQNRVQHSAKNAIQDRWLAQFLDFVVWGHEHECLIEPQNTVDGDGRFYVTQPGSSVATSLIEGESKKKAVLTMEICGDQWRTVTHPLTKVRPFQYLQVALAEQIELDPEDPSTVTSFLEGKVTDMIAKAKAATPPGSTAPLPLVRIKVDYTGFSTINPQRFGQKFVGKVANPHDILLFHKSAAKKKKRDEGEDAGGIPGVDMDTRPEALDQAQIEALISQNLKENLKILPEAELGIALHNFVEKEEKASLSNFVKDMLAQHQKSLNAEAGGMDFQAGEGAKEGMERLLAHHLEGKAAKAETNKILRRAAGGGGGGAGAGAMDDVDDDGDDMPPPAATPAKRGRGGGAAAAKGKGKGKQGTLGDMWSGAASAASGGGGGGAASGAGGLNAFLAPSQGGASTSSARGGGGPGLAEDTISDEELGTPAPVGRGRGRGRGRAAAAGRGRGKAAAKTPSKAPAPRARSSRTAAKKASYVDSDVESIEDDSGSDAAAELDMEEEDDHDLDEEEEVEEVEAPRSGRKRGRPAASASASAGRGRAGGAGGPSTQASRGSKRARGDDAPTYVIDSDEDDGGRGTRGTAGRTGPVSESPGLDTQVNAARGFGAVR